MDHPSEQTLKRFASGTATREERRAVVAHLLKGCTGCAHTLKAMLEPQPISHRDYDGALDRFDRRFLASLQRSVNPKVA